MRYCPMKNSFAMTAAATKAQARPLRNTAIWDDLDMAADESETAGRGKAGNG
jgi:hypothetical protein